MARPRVFDVDKAVHSYCDVLEKRLRTDLRCGDLTEEMGITPPSFYFAFESKGGLFRKVVEHYATTYLGFMEDALRQPTALGVAPG
jgi:hypothetical protein